jgi:phosphate transport system substrate-binding protein
MARKGVLVGRCADIPNHIAFTLLVNLAVSAADCRIRDAEHSDSKTGEGPSSSSRASDLATTGHSGRIKIDGPSTVYPIPQAAAEEFMIMHRTVAIPIGVAGTAGGFKRLVVDELAMNVLSQLVMRRFREVCQ